MAGCDRQEEPITDVPSIDRGNYFRRHHVLGDKHIGRKTIEHSCQLYPLRWGTEEYHICLKNGMSIEDCQFTDTDRLEQAIALTSITAITLLNLRDDSRIEETKDFPATEYIDSEYVDVLSAWRHSQHKVNWTASRDVLGLVRLSGHQNRKRD